MDYNAGDLIEEVLVWTSTKGKEYGIEIKPDYDLMNNVKQPKLVGFSINIAATGSITPKQAIEMQNMLSKASALCRWKNIQLKRLGE